MSEDGADRDGAGLHVGAREDDRVAQRGAVADAAAVAHRDGPHEPNALADLAVLADPDGRLHDRHALEWRGPAADDQALPELVSRHLDSELAAQRVPGAL